MIQLYSDSINIYSVDMMFSYIKTNKSKLPEVNIIMADFSRHLNNFSWGNPEKNTKYSPMSVIKNPTSNPTEYKKIINADSSFPIIISENGNVIDGLHRLSKAYIEKKNHITAYIFDDKLMAKFIIGEKGEWKKVNAIPVYEFINMFYDRFCNETLNYKNTDDVNISSSEDSDTDSD